MSEKRNGGLPVIVTAHSGFAAAGGAQDKSEDNTMDNIIKALNHGPDAIEVDVHYIDTDGDGEPDALWLGHDYADPAINPSAEDVLLLLLGRHPRSAELHTAVDAMRIQLDLKTEDSIFPALELAEKVGFPIDRLILAGAVRYDFVQQNHARLHVADKQGLELWMSPREIVEGETEPEAMQDMDAFVARIRALGLERVVVNARYTAITDEIKARLNVGGINVSVWTLNSEEAVASQMERGMYNVTTRLPECLARRNALRGE